MPTGRSFEERISELQERQKQLKEQERKLKAQQLVADKKARIKHLMEIGGIIEDFLGRPVIADDIVNFRKFLEAQENRGSFFSKAMGITVEQNTLFEQ